MNTPEPDLPELIAELVAEDKTVGAGRSVALIKPATWLCVGPASAAEEADEQRFDGVIHCTEKADERLEKKYKARYLHLACTDGKLGSRDLRRELPKLDDYFQDNGPFKNLLVCCPTGKDISVGVALAALCLYANDDRSWSTHRNTFVDKNFIRQKLSWITAASSNANPSRATLQSVNAYLMSGSSPRSTLFSGSSDGTKTPQTRLSSRTQSRTYTKLMQSLGQKKSLEIFGEPESAVRNTFSSSSSGTGPSPQLPGSRQALNVVERAGPELADGLDSALEPSSFTKEQECMVPA
ncbi:hypothetical protein LTS18_001707, partial [Coniosporium uncinatum]